LATAIRLAASGVASCNTTASLMVLGSPWSASCVTPCASGAALTTAVRIAAQVIAAAQASAALVTSPGSQPQVGIDASVVAASHTVIFPGCGSRTVVFDGGNRVVEFEGGTRVVEFGGAINAVPF
jgi:hypothetical protein